MRDKAMQARDETLKLLLVTPGVRGSGLAVFNTRRLLTRAKGKMGVGDHNGDLDLSTPNGFKLCSLLSPAHLKIELTFIGLGRCTSPLSCCQDG